MIHVDYELDALNDFFSLLLHGVSASFVMKPYDIIIKLVAPKVAPAQLKS